VNTDFFFQFYQYIKSKDGSIANATMNVFKNLKQTLKTFHAQRIEAITFDKIGFNFYEEFRHYLITFASLKCRQ